MVLDTTDGSGVLPLCPSHVPMRVFLVFVSRHKRMRQGIPHPTVGLRRNTLFARGTPRGKAIKRTMGTTQPSIDTARVETVGTRQDAETVARYKGVATNNAEGMFFLLFCCLFVI